MTRADRDGADEEEGDDEAEKGTGRQREQVRRRQLDGRRGGKRAARRLTVRCDGRLDVRVGEAAC